MRGVMPSCMPALSDQSGKNGNRELVYLCLQATHEGQASYAHVREIIRGLRARGWNVTLFQPGYASTGKSPGALQRLVEFIRVQSALIGHLRHTRALLYVRSHFAAFPAGLCAAIMNLPVIQELNGPYEDMFIAWPWTRCFRRLFIWLAWKQLQWSDVVIAVTPQLKDWVLQQMAGKQVEVIPNGANTNLFFPTSRKPDGLPEQYVVFFGALAAWQGIDAILRMVTCRVWPDNVSLVIIGDGSEREKVEKAARQSKVVRYLGTVPYGDVPGIVANSIAGLIPKNSQGDRAKTGLYPLKLFETLSCGVPAIATDFPGQADLIRQHRCGIVVPPGDSEAMADAVAYLEKNPEIRQYMGERGRRAIAAEHSWDIRAANTDKILATLLEREFKR
jgi:glycosyltransferase involved in cell wall biosynthesis